jgi:hypothetical protein
MKSKYRHERLKTPAALARRGKTKYRSITTPGGAVIRIAFPPGRRKKGSGEVQAILHKRNPVYLPPIAMTLGYMDTYGVDEGLNWMWFHVLNAQDKENFEKYLVSIEHPSAYQAGTAEWRFKNYMREAFKSYTKRLKNPLTPKETRNVLLEALVHSRIRGTAKKSKAYYEGMADGMRDIAREYGRIKGTDAGLRGKQLKAHLAMLNPRRVKIYDQILQITARKGPGHKCDAACKRAGHIYYHDFKTKNSVYGNPDGSLTIE